MSVCSLTNHVKISFNGQFDDPPASMNNNYEFKSRYLTQKMQLAMR